MMNQQKDQYNAKKQERREKKKTMKRNATGEEVIYIFEKILEDWKTIRIFNTIIQQNPQSNIDKKWVEQIASGNCKVYLKELKTEERYNYYLELREKVYAKQTKSLIPILYNLFILKYLTNIIWIQNIYFILH